MRQADLRQVHSPSVAQAEGLYKGWWWGVIELIGISHMGVRDDTLLGCASKLISPSVATDNNPASSAVSSNLTSCPWEKA